MRRSSNGTPIGRAAAWKGLALVCAVGLILLVLTVVIYAHEDLNNLETGLLQFIFLLVSSLLSYYIGRESVLASAQDVIRPHARKSIRRIVNLATGLQGLAVGIDTYRANIQAAAATDPSGQPPMLFVEQALDSLALSVRRELRTAEDAVEDWQDIVPDELESLEQSGELR